MNAAKLNSEFLQYIVQRGYQPGDRIPALGELSDDIGISIGKLREQLEVARSLGIVEVRPRTGIRLLSLDFLPTVRYALLFAIATMPSHFESFSALRHHVEAGFWCDAVALLTDDDKQLLQELMRSAWAKLTGSSIQIPHTEHRELHLTIFRRLENPFVKGIIEAYWEAYEAVELHSYADYEYLREVWNYHQRIVDSILAGNAEEGRALLLEHTQLLRHRVEPTEQPQIVET